MEKGLIFFGSPAVGKSTLELNLRAYYFGNPLTQNGYQSDGVRCFIGKTAKSHNRLMSTGGAEAYDGSVLPDADWYVASVPTNGRAGLEAAIEFLEDLDEIYAICLFSDERATYHENRTMFFSNRKPIKRRGPSKLKFPSFVPENRCYPCRTEDLQFAFEWSLDLLGRTEKSSPDKLLLLEEFA